MSIYPLLLRSTTQVGQVMYPCLRVRLSQGIRQEILAMCRHYPACNMVNLHTNPTWRHLPPSKILPFVLHNSDSV